jgi:DNA-cytosine methyltransferase
VAAGEETKNFFCEVAYLTADFVSSISATRLATDRQFHKGSFFYFLGANMIDKPEGIVVLSLFDGMSCGQIALERAGIKVKKYYASEIDKYAIKITQKNYPDTIQLGDINGWQGWDIETPDLIIAGSPCQGFSIAGHGLNFDDPRSKLFFVFCNTLAFWQGRNPKIKYLLENVKMKKVWKDIITDHMKMEPVLINSALLSAQNRQRLYWANWDIPQPDDLGIFLKDIIETGEVGRDKSYTIDANYFKGGNPKSYFEDGRRQRVFKNTSQSHRRAVVKEPSKNGLVFVGGLGDKDWAKDGKRLSRNYPQGRRIYSDEGKAASLSADGVGSVGGHTGIYRIGTALDVKGHDYNKRVYSQDGKSPSLAAHTGGNLEPKIAMNEYTYRKLTVLECERLQTVPEGYTEGVSNTQRYRMLGNGWTIDVIAHIFKHMEI